MDEFALIYSSMVLRLQTGADEDGTPLYKDKSYPRLRRSSTAAEIFAAGTALASLSAWELHHVQRVDRSAVDRIA